MRVASPIDSAGTDTRFMIGQKPAYGNTGATKTTRSLSADSLAAWINRIIPVVDTSGFWNILGNSGTSQLNNFIGTKDSSFLYFRLSNIPFGTFRKDSNIVAIGESAAIGNTGSVVYAIGGNAALNNSGGDVVLIGASAGGSNSGNNVVAIGNSAGGSGTGSNVIALGASAGGGNTGDHAVSIGTSAGGANSGNRTIGIGYQAGLNNTGNNFIAIGDSAGWGNTFNQSIALGSQAIPTADNQFYLSDSCSKAVMKLNGGAANSVLTNDGSGNASWHPNLFIKDTAIHLNSSMVQNGFTTPIIVDSVHSGQFIQFVAGTVIDNYNTTPAGAGNSILIASGYDGAFTTVATSQIDFSVAATNSSILSPTAFGPGTALTNVLYIQISMDDVFFDGSADVYLFYYIRDK